MAQPTHRDSTLHGPRERSGPAARRPHRDFAGGPAARCAKLTLVLVAALALLAAGAQASPVRHGHHARRHGHHHTRRQAVRHGRDAAGQPPTDGSYSGSQEDGFDVTFTVSANGTHVTNFSTWAVPGCTAELVGVQLADMTIHDRSFAGTEQVDGGTVNISGRFDSAGRVSGSVDWTASDAPDCDSTRSFTASG